MVTNPTELVEMKDISPNTTSATFDQLIPCTKYFFKVRAQTAGGLSQFSAAVYIQPPRAKVCQSCTVQQFLSNLADTGAIISVDFPLLLLFRVNTA